MLLYTLLFLFICQKCAGYVIRDPEDLNLNDPGNTIVNVPIVVNIFKGLPWNNPSPSLQNSWRTDQSSPCNLHSRYLTDTTTYSSPCGKMIFPWMRHNHNHDYHQNHHHHHHHYNHLSNIYNSLNLNKFATTLPPSTTQYYEEGLATAETYSAFLEETTTVAPVTVEVSDSRVDDNDSDDYDYDGNPYN